MAKRPGLTAASQHTLIAAADKTLCRNPVPEPAYLAVDTDIVQQQPQVGLQQTLTTRHCPSQICQQRHVHCLLLIVNLALDPDIRL
jgi:hypothetical protein